MIIKFKPALWYIKGKRGRENGGYFPIDFVSVDSNSFKEAKLQHKWGQPKEFFENFIEHLTYENSVVLDPFAGSGIVAKVCQEMKRNYILFEIDKNTFDKIPLEIKS